MRIKQLAERLGVPIKDIDISINIAPCNTCRKTGGTETPACSAPPCSIYATITIKEDNMEKR